MKRLLLMVALPLYILDQVTKALVLAHVPDDAVLPVIPGFFNIVHVYNTGAAFGMLKGAHYFFLGLSAAAIVVLAVLMRKGSFRDAPSRVAAALLLAGVCGNLTDRLLHGHVIDFLDFFLPIYGRWPAFNVADSCICIAAVLLVLSAVVSREKSN